MLLSKQSLTRLAAGHSKFSLGEWSGSEVEATPLRLSRNLDARTKQKIQAVLRRCGRSPETKLTLLSDGEDGLRGVVGWFGKNCRHRLDWFHVRRRLEKIARELLYLPHRADFSRYLSRHSQNLARVKHVLWNQGIEMADWAMKIFRYSLVEDAWDHPEINIKRFQEIEVKLDELRSYLNGILHRYTRHIQPGALAA